MTTSENTNLDRSGGQDEHVCNPPTACLACLAGSGLSAELTDSEIEVLFKITNVRQLSKGEILISEGDDANRLYSIAKGSFEVKRGASADREVELVRLGPGTITGELAFLDGLKRTATVRAATDNCCVIELERENLESILEVKPRLVYKVMRAILRSAHRTVGTMDKTYLDLIGYIQG
jgi:CRP/FNR family transcriptional regulator, cyclic AMP receptor protein